jgi:hypothetical protein
LPALIAELTAAESALTIAMQNAGGLTPISDIITAATAFYTFIYF